MRSRRVESRKLSLSEVNAELRRELDAILASRSWRLTEPARFPGRIRAWGLHQRSTDRLFVAEGLVQIVVFDGREGSPTLGRVNLFTVSPKNPGLLVIGPNLYHGWKNIGTNEAIIINMPTSMYDHEAPDALDLPYGTQAARRIVPFQW